MKIVVNDIAASCGGALTILKQFYEYIKKNDKKNQWVFLLSDYYIQETDNIKIHIFPKVKKNGINKMVFDCFTSAKIINRMRPDIYFSMQNTYTYGVKAKQVIYVHQALPFQNERKFSFIKEDERKLAFYQYVIGFIIKKSILRSDKVIVQTKWMKNEIMKKLKVDYHKIIQIKPNVKSINSGENIQFIPSHFFYPTSNVKYKNNNSIYQASEILEHKKVKHKIELTLNESKVVSNINFIGRIPYDDVIRKYKESVLIFPSYIETFGYPLEEARTVGTIILASDCDFSHELLEDYPNAYFFDYKNPKELAKLMEQVITEKIKKKDFKADYEKNDSWKLVIEELESMNN